MPKGVYIKSEEHKKKIAETLHKKFSSGELINPFKGKKHTSESLKKMSETIKKAHLNPEIKIKFLGKNHPNWKGGITPKNVKIRRSPEYKQWVQYIFTKFDYTCASCSERGWSKINGDLCAHHIQPFATHPESRFDITNGLCLHDKCHKQLHKDMRMYNEM